MSINPVVQDPFRPLREMLGAHLLPPLADMTVGYATPYRISIHGNGPAPRPSCDFVSGELNITQDTLDSEGKWQNRTVKRLPIIMGKIWDTKLSLLETAINSAENGKDALEYFEKYRKNKKSVSLDDVFATLTAKGKLTAKLAAREMEIEQIRFQIGNLFPNLYYESSRFPKSPYYFLVRQEADALLDVEPEKDRDLVAESLRHIMSRPEKRPSDSAQERAKEILAQAQETVLERELEALA